MEFALGRKNVLFAVLVVYQDVFLILAEHISRRDVAGSAVHDATHAHTHRLPHGAAGPVPVRRWRAPGRGRHGRGGGERRSHRVQRLESKINDLLNSDYKCRSFNGRY